LPDDADLSNDPLTFLYVEYSKPWSSMTFTLSSGNTVGATLSVQYYNTAGATPAWEEVADIANGTVVDGVPFRKSGTITFTAPAGWGKLSGRYPLRFSTQDADLDKFRISSLKLSLTEPLKGDQVLGQVMALAPAGWSLDPAGKINLASDVYMMFAGESVLTALVKIAEQTGEHFVRSPSGRRIRWLGPTATAEDIAALSSGLRAIETSDPATDTMALVDLSMARDSYDLYTRAYVYGGGMGDGRLTLAKCERTAPAGYTLSTTGSYLENTTAAALYGRIDRREDFSDIVPVDTSTEQAINAANALFDRAYEILRRKSTLQYAYNLSVVPGSYPLYPGQTLRVVRHEWSDGYHAVNIDTDLWVLEVTQSIGENGILIVDPVVSTVDYWPENVDARALAKTVGDVDLQRTVQLPEAGYSNTAAGTPRAITVQDSKVISVVKVTPIDDGTYPQDYTTQDLRSITVRGGIIVGIELTDVGAS
jgi:hypothetical protein